MQEQIKSKMTNEEYENLIGQTLDQKSFKEKTIVKGKVVSIENESVIIDVGLKSEGRIPKSEFTRQGQDN